MTAPRWLLLAHRLPTRPSNARVKTWRRLQQLGAVPTRNSVYVLPNGEQAREDFEWIRSEIVALGGEATVFAADVVDARGADDLVAAFRRARGDDYRHLRRQVDRLAAASRRRRPSPKARAAFTRTVQALRDRFAEIDRIDFFRAPGREAIAEALASLERSAAAPPPPPPDAAAAPESPADYRGRRWVTRPRPGVDRMASAWLIRRFIDPEAAFAFVERPVDGDVPFDMYVGTFSHAGPRCTFEVLADRFALDGRAVSRIAQIVHDLDMKDARYGAPDAPAVGRLIDGLREMHADDQTLLAQGIAMFDALARSFESSGGAPHGRRPRTHARRSRKGGHR